MDQNARRFSSSWMQSPFGADASEDEGDVRVELSLFLVDRYKKVENSVSRFHLRREHELEDPIRTSKRLTSLSTTQHQPKLLTLSLPDKNAS